MLVHVGDYQYSGENRCVNGSGSVLVSVRFRVVLQICQKLDIIAKYDKQIDIIAKYDKQIVSG